MKISIITVCYNAENTIEDTINSVIKQRYSNIEYIVLDGLSTDNTMDIVNKYSSSIHRTISKKDKGMYDAINNGIAIATGDIIGILNADDVFENDFVLESVADSFSKNKGLQSLIGDIAFENKAGKIIRHYSAEKWTPGKFAWGFMPPHPSFYCKRDLFDKWGYYRIDFDIAADYELLIRFFKTNSVSYKYLPQVMVRMKMGGKSTNGLKSTFKINKEILRACRQNGIKTNYFKLA